MTGACVGWVLSREIHESSLVPTLFKGAEGDTVPGEIAMTGMDRARSETPCMRRNISHGSREVPRLSVARVVTDRNGKPKGASLR